MPKKKKGGAERVSRLKDREKKGTPYMNTPMAMSPRDAARAIGISISSLYRLIKQGRIRTVKLGSRTLVPTSALAELIGEEVLS